MLAGNCVLVWFFFFKQKTAYDMRISDWSSDVCSSDLAGGDIGVRSDSTWNNPEPEIVLVADPDGRAVGATLGNDVNLRDFEGRSALLLGKAKDNNASCAIGPFIRLFGDEDRKSVV